MESEFDKMKIEWLRKGNVEQIKYLDNLHKVMLPSQIKRIQQNDKSVLKELVLPKWMKWDLLFQWSNNLTVMDGRRCVLCEQTNSAGIDFKGKWICDGCFVRLKNH